MYHSEYTIGAIQAILDIQRKTLQHIDLGEFPAGGKGIPDFSQYQCLRTLTLSHKNLLLEDPQEAARKFTAPLLDHLAIRFRTKDFSSAKWTEFRTDQVSYIESLVRYRLEARVMINLKSMFIDFNPDQLPWFGDSLGNDPWPWDFLEQAQQCLGGCGISMTYSTPIWTREEWAKNLAAVEKHCVSRSRKLRSTTGRRGGRQGALPSRGG